MIQGILLATLIVPLLNGLCELLLTFIELLKSKMAVSIAKSQANINQMNEPEGQIRSIGFAISDDEEEED